MLRIARRGPTLISDLKEYNIAFPKNQVFFSEKLPLFVQKPVLHYV